MIKLKLTAVCCLLGGFLFLSGCTTYNTATRRNEFIFISTPQEMSMGLEAHRELASKYKIITGTEEALRLERIGQQIARVSDRRDMPYYFYLIENDEINAFTIPGGRVYFYTGLFRKLTDAQVAAVLAHELAHGSAKHTVKKFQAALGYNMASSVIGRILETKAPGTASIASMGANAIAQLAMSAYGRQDEYEADRLGIKYLYLAGIDLNAMIETFYVLEKNTKKEYTPLILRSHPFIKDRIEAVKAEIGRVSGR